MYSITIRSIDTSSIWSNNILYIDLISKLVSCTQILKPMDCLLKLDIVVNNKTYSIFHKLDTK